MIVVINVTRKSSPYLEPQAAEAIVARLKNEGIDARLVCTSFGRIDDQDLVDLHECAMLVFYGLVNVRGIIDEDRKERNRVARWLRNQGYSGFLLAGGHGPTLDPEGTILECPVLDAVLLGEPEQTAVPAVRTLLSGRPLSEVNGVVYRDNEGVIRINAPFPPSPKLIKAPIERPYLHKLLADHPASRLAAILESSRGCYHRGCTFCSTPRFSRVRGGRPFRTKPVAVLIEEMREVGKYYGVRRFVIEDDSFCPPGPAGKRRLLELEEKIADLNRPIELSLVLRSDVVNIDTRPVIERLRDRGLRLVYLGVESFCEEDLLFYEKGIGLQETLAGVEILQELGFSMDVGEQLRIKPGLLPFHPYTRLDTIAKQLDVWNRLRLTPVKMLACVEVYNGTPLAERVRADGLSLPNTREGFRFQDPATGVFHRTARAGLRLIYQPRKRIRQIEKTILGLVLDPSLNLSIRDIREKLERRFASFFERTLRDAMSGANADDLQPWLEDLRRTTGIGTEARDDEAEIAAVWEIVRAEAKALYETAGHRVPNGAEPVYFRPCWFPVIH